MTTYRQVVQAFKEGRKAGSGNYFTDGTRLYLFGNLIAERQSNGKIRVTDAGYATHTTHKTLRALGVNIRRKQGRSYIDDQPYQSGTYHEMQARHGYHGTVKRPTRILVAEGGKPEHVDVYASRNTHRQSNRSGGYGINIKMPKINLGGSVGMKGIKMPKLGKIRF